MRDADKSRHSGMQSLPHRTMIRICAGTMLLLAIGAAPAGVRAADLRDILTDYSVGAWSQKDGLPAGAVNALAQDAEGYLWVGTEIGLLRFDGVRFTALDATGGELLPNLPVRALLLGRDCSLWVGFGGSGGISRIAGRQVRNYTEPDGLPAGAITFLSEDASGVVWSGATHGLFRFVDERWENYQKTTGLPAGLAYSAYESTAHDFIVGMGDGIFRLAKGAATFERVEQFAYQTPLFYESPRALTEDSLGQMLVTDPVVGFRPIGEAPLHARTRPRGRGRQLLRDRHDNLWVGTSGQGLWRVRIDPRSGDYLTERLTALTGLLSDGIVAMLEDRDGNLWVGTTEGLNRLTRRKVAQVTNIGLVVGVEATADGSVWVGTSRAAAAVGRTGTQYGAGQQGLPGQSPPDRAASSTRRKRCGWRRPRAWLTSPTAGCPARCRRPAAGECRCR